MLTARLGFDESMNLNLVKVNEGDTIAYEIKDKRGKWRWSLGTVKAKPEPRVTELEVWKRKDRVLSPEEMARAAAIKAKIQEQKKDIVSRKLAAQRRIDTLDEKRNKVVYNRTRIEAQLEKASVVMAKAKEEIAFIDDKDIREMRSYRTAPELVRLILEAVTLILESGSGAAEDKKKTKVTWDDCLAKIRQPTFIRDVQEFDASRLLQSTVSIIKKDYLSNPRFNAESAKRASAAVRKLELWVEAQMLSYETTAEVKNLQEEITMMDADVEELEKQGKDDENTVAELETAIENLEGEHDDLLEEDDEVDYDAMADGNPSKAKKGEWMPTGKFMFILTTSILSNLERGSLEEEFDQLGGRTFRFDPTQVLATARHGAAAALLSQSASLPMGFKLQMPAGMNLNNAAAALTKAVSGAASPTSPLGYDLSKKIKELEEANKALTAERDALQSALNSDLCSLESTRNDAEGEVNSAALEALKKELEEAQNAALKLEEEKSELADKLIAKGKEQSESSDKVHAQLVEAKVKEEELLRSIEAYKERHVEFKADIAKHESRIDVLEKERDEARKHTETTLENLSRAMAKLTASVPELEAAKAEAAELRAQLDSSTSDRTSGEEKLEAAEAKVSSLTTDVTDLQSQIDRLKADLEESKRLAEERSAAEQRTLSEKVALEASLEASEESIAKLTTEKTTVEQRIAALELQLKTSEERSVTLQQSLETSEKTSKTLEIKVAELTAALEASKGSVDEGIAKLQQQLEAANKGRQEAEDAQSALRKEKEEGEKRLTATSDELEEVIIMLKKELEAASASAKAKEEDAAATKAALDKALADLEAAKQQLSESSKGADAASAAMAEQLKALEASKAALEADVARLTAALEASKGSVDEGIAKLQEQLETANKEKKAADEKLAALQKDKGAVDAALAANATAKQQLEDEIAALKKELETASASAKAKEEDAAATKAALDKALADLEAAKQQLSESSKGADAASAVVAQRLAVIEVEYKTLKSEHTTLEQRTASYSQEVTQLHSEIKALKSSLADAQELAERRAAEVKTVRSQTDAAIADAVGAAVEEANASNAAAARRSGAKAKARPAGRAGTDIIDDGVADGTYAAAEEVGDDEETHTAKSSSPKAKAKPHGSRNVGEADNSGDQFSPDASSSIAPPSPTRTGGAKSKARPASRATTDVMDDGVADGSFKAAPEDDDDAADVTCEEHESVFKGASPPKSKGKAKPSSRTIEEGNNGGDQLSPEDSLFNSADRSAAKSKAKPKPSRNGDANNDNEGFTSPYGNEGEGASSTSTAARNQSHLCHRTPLDVGYVVLTLAMVLAVCVSGLIPAALGTVDDGALMPNVFDSRYNGQGYLAYAATKTGIAALAFLFVVPNVLVRLNDYTVASQTGPIGRYAHLLLTLVGIACALVGAGVMKPMAPTSWVLLLLSGAAEVFIIAGAAVMLCGSGLSVQFALTSIFAVAQLVAPTAAYAVAWAVATAFDMTYASAALFSLWVSIAGAAVWSWLVLTPYVATPIRSGKDLSASSSYAAVDIAKNAGSSPNSPAMQPVAAPNTAANSNAHDREGSLNASHSGHMLLPAISGEEFCNMPGSTAFGVGITPIGVLAAQFPDQWSAFKELWGMDTQSLVAAGVAGGVLGTALAYAQMMVGLQMKDNYANPALGVKAHLYAASIFFMGGFGIFAAQRAVARILHWQQMPSNASCLDLIASPAVLKLSSVAALGCLVAGSIMAAYNDVIVGTVILFAAAIAFAVQELFAELFPSQYYRHSADGLSIAYNKLRPNALYCLVLLFAAYFSGGFANFIVTVVNAARAAGIYDAAYGDGRNSASAYGLFGACGLVALMVLRGLVPIGRRRNAALVHAEAGSTSDLREHEPLMDGGNCLGV